MKRMTLNLAALAVICGGAQRLYAEEVVIKCCDATFGATCCGPECSAGWFYCKATLVP
ncbi:MAG TPA: hypothetical protein VF613_03080 [Longimicrobium sp.]|jgi:hypothetical protein